MRSYQPEKLQQLENPACLQRLKPFLSEPFDTISLERPGFLQEIGLQPDDEAWLRASAYFWSWAPSPVVARALSEEARSRKETPGGFLERAQGLLDEALWRQAERLMLRSERLLFHPEASRAAKSMQLPLKELEALRTRWRQEKESSDQLFLDGWLLQLRGQILKPADLIKRMEAQASQKFWFFFRRARPVLTDVRDEEIEVTVALSSPLDASRQYAVAASFQKELLENQELSPELWAKQWIDYLGKRQRVSRDEFVALLDHFSDKERFRWPNLVAAGGTKARRAVAAVALKALERVESAEDTASLERLWQMIPDFSERYELQQVLKKRFGV